MGSASSFFNTWCFICCNSSHVKLYNIYLFCFDSFDLAKLVGAAKDILSISLPLEGGLGIPVVLLVVEGGTDAIQDVSASLAQGIPVVVCAGTGRAADILTYAYNHTTTTHEWVCFY